MKKKKLLKVRLAHWYLLLPILLITVMAKAQYAGGTGTLADPYTIATPTHLDNVRLNLSAHFKLIASIDLNVSPFNSGTGWVPIGDSSTPFTGSFDGGIWSVQNLFIDDPGADDLGLFGVARGATFKNLRMNDPHINHYIPSSALYTSLVSDRIGALLGTDNWLGSATGSTFENINIIRPEIFGNKEIGGMVGYTFSTAKEGHFLNCRVDLGFVKTLRNSEASVGGMIGFNKNSDITNC